SPSRDTQSGRAILEEHPDSPGSLGIAISEAVEDAAQREDTAYSLGSVLNHVLLHQTVIGQEALAQMELADAFPDVVIGCVGGGSNFAGLAFPFLREKIAGREIDVLACEPAACPTLTRGLVAYDFGDTSKLTPLVPMHTLGHDFVPAPIHAGGLRYHGVAPLISQLVRDGLIRAEAYLQNDVFASAVLFAGSEGILPAPEAAHAIHGTLQVAKAADEAGEERTILLNLSGHGHFDMAAYDNYFAGKIITSTGPPTPTIIRIQPIASSLTLPMSPLTPQTRMAPAATSNRLTPIPIEVSFQGSSSLQPNERRCTRLFGAENKVRKPL